MKFELPRAGERKYNSSLELFRDLFWGRTTKSGILINDETALKATAALACVRAITDGISQVPFRLMRKKGDQRAPVEDDSRQDRFSWDANELQTAAEFWDTVGIRTTLRGSSLVWKNMSRVGGGEIMELIPIPKFRVEQKKDGSLKFYGTLADDREVVLPNNEVWYIKGPSYNVAHALDPVKLAAEAIGLSLVAEQHAAESFSSGLNLDGVLTTDASLTKEQRAGMRKSWLDAHEKEGGAMSRIAMLSNGVTFIPMSGKNTDGQLIENRKFQIEEICRAFKVIPLMVGYSDKTATYASAEQMFIAHVVHTLSPWYRRLELSAGVNMLSPKERRGGFYFKFFANALMRGSMQARADYATKMYNIGAVNPNEVREWDDLNPYEGGDQYRVPLNMKDPNDPAPEDPNKKPEEENAN